MPTQIEKRDPFRAVNISINYKWARANKIGIPELVWGSDIFINHVPVAKSILLANILVWMAFFMKK